MEIYWAKKINRISPNESECQNFFQKQANRLAQGFCRYGPADKKQRYMTRMKMELNAYKRTGNQEHLFNIANYCILESTTPENLRFHFDNTIKSVTRGKI